MLVPTSRNAIPPQPVMLERLVLAEGDTPAHFLDALVKSMRLDEHIEIRNYGGLSQLKSFFRTLASTTAFQERVKSVGIIRDAEGDPKAARQSVNSLIASTTMATAISVKVAILPDDLNPGMIETLCLRSVVGNPVFECIDQFMACVEAKGIPLPKGPVRAKHVAEVYLATQPEPQLMPGVAAHKGTWPLEHPAFDDIKAFLWSL